MDTSTVYYLRDSNKFCHLLKKGLIQVLVILFVFFLPCRKKIKNSKAKGIQRIIPKEAEDPSSTIQQNYPL